MPRRPSPHQLAITRAIRAAQKTGARAVKIGTDGTIEIIPGTGRGENPQLAKERMAEEREAEEDKYWIYVIRDDKGIIKIGISCDVNRRANELRLCGSGHLTVVHALGLENDYVAKQLEREVHIALRDHRIEGEWFDVSETEAISAIHSSAKRLGYIR